MMSWVNRYVGIPYKFNGNSKDGSDCWGLVCLVEKEQFGKTLPVFNHDDFTRKQLAELVNESVPTVNVDKVLLPEIGDIVLVNLVGEPIHVGVVVGNPGEHNFLHTLRFHDSAIDRYDSARWNKRIEGFYRVR